jgi:hypothetical protein
MIDVIQLVRDGKGRYEWAEVCSEHDGYKLYVRVMRDAMKFDGMPAMTWKREPVVSTHPDYGKIYDGVRMPAQAHELQQIADMLKAMLMTPKVIDMLWLQAGLRFDSVVNTPYPSASAPTIVATSDIHRVHQEIEKRITNLGGDDGTKLIDCVGKFWCLINDLNNKPPVSGDECACNYGWLAKVASGPGLTPGTQCWQRPGFAHNKLHWDPSQTIRLMLQQARLIRPDGTEEMVDLRDLAGNPDLCALITHDGKPLTYLRQKGVPEEEPIGFITLPTLTIEGRGPVA